MSTPIFRAPPSFKPCFRGSNCSGSPLKSRRFQCVSVVNRQPKLCRNFLNLKFSNGCFHSEKSPVHRVRFGLFASAAAGESPEAPTETRVEEPADELTAEENADGAVGVEAAAINGEVADVEGSGSAILASLHLYREALASNDGSKVAEIEALLISFEEEKLQLQQKVVSLTEELSPVKDRVLRISADFDNFRKRTERERLSLVTNAQGEVAESLLPVVDNFERAKAQIKIETEAEEKISNNYQSIYKQFVEILKSLGVAPVQTVGKPFDPMLHEAIMREESADFEEGMVIEEYRKGFKLGDRLLRPSMVKVSSGPGPSKTEAGRSKEAENVEESGEQASVEP